MTEFLYREIGIAPSDGTRSANDPNGVVAAVVKQVAGELGLHACGLAVQWVLPEADAKAMGWPPGRIHTSSIAVDGWVDHATPTTVYLVLQPGGEALAKTVLHECRHAWQLAHGHSYGHGDAERWTWREKDADAWAGRTLAQIKGNAQMGMGALPWAS